MDIVKRLTLNRTPKDIPNRSLVCAKNMMIDDTGSFLTNDIGFKEAVHLEGEHIVGVIPCSSEIVILTADDAREGYPQGCHIYRKQDNSNELEEVLCNWQHHGGKITGTYTYNYKGELILVIAESGASEDVPLKSFIIKPNTDEATNVQYPYCANLHQTYAIEEEVPRVNCISTIQDGGELVCGVYTFFIRYEVDKDNFTKWFQITGDINIVLLKESKKYAHTYYGSGNNPVKQNIVKDSFKVNSNGISTSAIQLRLTVDETSVLDIGRAQIGYIIKRNGDIQGRIEGLYDLTNGLQVLVRTNQYIEEESIDNFLENPHQFFNVNHVTNYNNRLYIGEYKEYDNINYLNNTNVKIDISDGSEFINDAQNANTGTITHISYDLKFRIFCNFPHSEYMRKHFGGDLNMYDVRVDVDTNLLVNPTAFIAKVAKYIPVFKDLDGIYFLDNDDSAFLERNHAVLVVNKFAYEDPISGQRYYETFGIYETDTSVTTPSRPLGVNMISGYQIEFVEDRLDPQNSSLYLIHNGNRYDLFGGDTHLTVLLHHQVDNPQDPEQYIEDYVIDMTGDPITGNDVTKELANTITLKLTYTEGTPIESDTIIPDGDEGETEGVTGADGIPATPSANTRTLIPYQKYNFFIHYVRKDGSCTPGFLIGDKTYVVPYGNKIVPRFVVQQPTGTDFIGYFISYEDVERDTDTMLIIDEHDGVISMTSAIYEYDLEILRGSKIRIGDTTYYITPNTIKFIENRLTENHVEFKTDSPIPNIESVSSSEVGIICFVKSLIEAKYYKTAKTLYRLTPNIYVWNTPISSDEYLPDFYDRQTILAYFVGDSTTFKNEIIADPSIEYVFGIKRETNVGSTTDKTLYSVRYYFPQMYSKYPTSAMNVKEDFVRAAVVLAANGGGTAEIGINEFVGPDRLHDYLELQSAYKAKPSKSFTNYREDNISQFNKTVYRSDVISDESLVNGFRHFGVDEYKNITENKGKITNIVGIGFYLIVHTEYSMFVFDRSPRLTQRSQLDIPDTFEVDYQEVMPSNEGFGGLKYKEESIVTKNGYIWFDRVNRIIFKYENGQAQILSADINNFIKVLDIDTVRFAEDIIHNRIIVCIHTNNGDYLTLSYSFYSNTFISLHDYKFTDNYRTYNKSYVFDNTDTNKAILYEFDDNAIADYKTLTLDTGEDTIFPIFPTYPASNNKNKSYVDILFNEGYDAIKALNNLDYILNEIHNNLVFNIASEEELYRRFSGDSLIIYTDETNSGELDIHVPVGSTNDKTDSSINAIELNDNISYKYPAFNKGKWSLNYFRNRVTEPVTQSEVTGFSDNRSLIYGKYFVLRFIFNNDRKIKLDSVNINVQVY